MAEAMKNWDRLTRAQLQTLLLEKTQQVEKLQGSTSNGPYRPAEVAGMSVQEAIDMCLENKRTLTWKAAKMVAVGEGRFFPSIIPIIIEAFEDEMPGSSALIVNNNGKHDAEVADRHAVWLKANGFDKTPGVKVKAEKKKASAEIDPKLLAAITKGVLKTLMG